MRLFSNAAALYAAKVGQLQTALDEPDICLEAIDNLRLLVDCIVLTPDDNAPDGLAVGVHGDLAMILNLASAPVSSWGKLHAALENQNFQPISATGGILQVVERARRAIGEWENGNGFTKSSRNNWNQRPPHL